VEQPRQLITDRANLEFLMRRRLPTIPLILLLPLLGGCAPLDATPSAAGQAQAGLAQGGFYDCRLMSQGVATPGPDVRLMLRPVDAQGQLPLRVGQDHWQSLDVAAGSNGRVFDNSIYAWRFDRAGGVLTDIRNIETYDCTSASGAPGEAR
jgi:hypothetical protein